MSFKVGDKVKVIFHVNGTCDRDICATFESEEMGVYVGKTFEIDKVIEVIEIDRIITDTKSKRIWHYNLKDDSARWNWSDCMLEPAMEDWDK